MPRKSINSFIRTKKALFYLMLSLTSILSLTARSVSMSENTDYTNQIFSVFVSNKANTAKMDSVIYYTRGTNGLIVLPPSDWEPFPDNVRFRDTVIYNPAYLPIVFDGKILPPNLDFIRKDSVQEKGTFRLIPEEETFAPQLRRIQIIGNQRRGFYTNINNIRNVEYSASVLKDIPKLNEEDVTKKNILHDLITAEEPIKIAPIAIPKADVEYLYWLRNGEHSLQFSQNYLSSNWHKGGNSNYTIKNYHKFMLNYKKDKITFDNVMEWKLNLQRVNGAEKHGTNISEDLIRMENTFGLRAYNKWSYSSKLETRTQLFNSYPVNGDQKNTAFLSPLIVNLGLGMNYTLEKKFQTDKAKKLKFSQSISPISLNYTYLKDDSVAKRQGVDEGKNSKFEIGSSINSDLTFSFNRYMTWTSRLKYFTNYQRAELEFENKFDMALNRYLSTTIYVHLRFDDNDSAVKANTLGYFQLNEMLSFGLNYKW